MLIFAILIIPPIARSMFGKSIKIEKRILFFLLFLIYLLCALKAPSVGRDIAGYKRIYDMMPYQSWRNFDICYFEWGYELLMMIFTHVFRASFQQFMGCVYALVFCSYYFFIKRYSKDYPFSVLLYVCFTFFVFDMSAVRNMLGVAICLFVVPLAEKKTWRHTVLFILTVLIAAQIHKSAYVFLIVYFIIKIPVNKKSLFIYAVGGVALIAFRNQLYIFINLYLKPVGEAQSLSFSGNLLFYIMNIAAAGFIWSMARRQGIFAENPNLQKTKADFADINLFARLLYAALIIQWFSTGTTLTRLAAYLQIFVIVLLPSWAEKLDRKSRRLIKMFICLFLIWYFYTYALAKNALDIVPYKFFWEI